MKIGNFKPLWANLIAYSRVSMLLILTSCGNAKTEQHFLDTSISADGKTIAILSDAGMVSSKVKVINTLNKQWIDINAPARTTSIRFGINPDDIYLTYRLASDSSDSELLNINLSTSEFNRTTVYKGYGLIYPIELEDKQILIRACNPDGSLNCSRGAGVHWLLVKNNIPTTIYKSNIALNYAQPNYIRGKGFYWNIYKTDPTDIHESVGFAIDGTEIKSESLPLDDVAEGAFACDYKNARCLKPFVKDEKNTRGSFTFGINGTLEKDNCRINEVFGYIDRISITPDGKHSSVSLAQDAWSKRRIVYMNFDEKKCEPVVIDYFNVN